MELTYQEMYDFAIAQLRKDFVEEIKLIEELYLKHKDNFSGGYVTEAIKNDLRQRENEFLNKYHWTVPNLLYGSPAHLSQFFRECSNLCSQVYNYPFEIVHEGMNKSG